MRKDTLLKAIRDTLPVMAGYIVLGTGFGIIMSAAGYGTLLSLAMSLFIYAGSMQYAAVNLFSGGASLAAVALTTLAVNARHLFYGISMAEKYKNLGKSKPYLIFALTDETYSLVCNSDEGAAYYLTVSLFNHAYWVLGTLLGCILGSTVSFNTKGIDFALTALFITITVDQWMKSKDHFAALTGIVCSAASMLLFGRENFLIPAMVGITAVLLFKIRKEARND